MKTENQNPQTETGGAGTDASTRLHFWLALPGEAAKLRPLYQDMLEEIAAYGFSFEDAGVEAQYRIDHEIWPALNQGVGYLASEGKGIVGFNVWRIEERPLPQAWLALEVALYVAPGWRRQGVARRLRGDCLKRLRERAGGRWVTLLSSTQAENAPMNTLLARDMALASHVYTANLNPKGTL